MRQRRVRSGGDDGIKGGPFETRPPQLFFDFERHLVFESSR
jgi:hypothetical protein